MVRPRRDTTQLLSAATLGDSSALAELTSRVYGQLRECAADHLRRERTGHTLQPTALVHEAYLRLVDQPNLDWKSRTHFLAVASREMRRVLVEYARSRRAIKRGGGWTRVDLDGVGLTTEVKGIDLLDLDDALDKLSGLDPRQCKVVELRFFGGLTVEEVGEALGFSVKTVEIDWRMARAWLHGYLNDRNWT